MELSIFILYITTDPTLKVRKGSSEEIPLVQGKEQWLHFGKRNPCKMVGIVRGHQRADTLKP